MCVQSSAAAYSGAGVVPEGGQSWTNVGGFDQNKNCIVGGDQWKTDREKLAGRGTKMMGAEETDTEVLISEVAPCPDQVPQTLGGSMSAGLAGCRRCTMVVEASGLPQQRPAAG